MSQGKMTLTKRVKVATGLHTLHTQHIYIGACGCIYIYTIHALHTIHSYTFADTYAHSQKYAAHICVHVHVRICIYIYI